MWNLRMNLCTKVLVLDLNDDVKVEINCDFCLKCCTKLLNLDLILAQRLVRCFLPLRRKALKKECFLLHLLLSLSDLLCLALSKN